MWLRHQTRAFFLWKKRVYFSTPNLHIRYWRSSEATVVCSRQMYVYYTRCTSKKFVSGHFGVHKTSPTNNVIRSRNIECTFVCLSIKNEFMKNRDGRDIKIHTTKAYGKYFSSLICFAFVVVAIIFIFVAITSLLSPSERKGFELLKGWNLNIMLSLKRITTCSTFLWMYEMWIEAFLLRISFMHNQQFNM